MRKLLISIALWGGVSSALRKKILNFFGHKITAIYADCQIGRGPGHIFMEEGSYCNANCFFDLNDDIYIGSNVSIGMHCTFITTSHNIGSSTKRAGKTICSPIKIGDGSWIGGCCTILPGVTIGNGVVVGAGSLSTTDLEANGLYLGRPAKLIRRLHN